ncbi:MAG: YdaU family protein [Patescibacteria group bacterium]|nr:YdaU family protein [Patescibacteria group bacterium]
MHTYPKHIGDWASATIGLNLTERGAYEALLDQYYVHEMPLPLDRRECYRLAAASGAAERKAVDYVLTRYFTQEADGWHNKRADEELAKYREKAAKASESASSRWSKRNADAIRTHIELNANASETQCEGNAKAMRTQCEGNANQNQNQNQEPEPITPKENPLAAAPPGVRQEVWDAWRRHRGRKLTPDAVRLQTRQLAEFAAAGDDPNAVIEQSIRQTWAGLFPLKPGTGPPAKQSMRERAVANMDAITGVSDGRRPINGTAERVDSPPVPALPVALREQGGADVGRH